MNTNNTSQTRRAFQLETQHSIATLREGLTDSEKIVYRDNGNRSISGKQMLKLIESKSGYFGVTRLAEISHFSISGYPVFQSCRPNILMGPDYGQNTGAQGKGPTPTQAKISCLMETLESYCAEPRSPEIITADYQYLKEHQAVLDPKTFHPANVYESIQDTDVLTWTSAYATHLDEKVLIPAETVYFPLIPKNYGSKKVFVSCSTGLAAGATYLEAVIHSLYEVIERYYEYLFHRGKIEIEAVYEEEIKNQFVKKYLEQNDGDYELQVYALKIPKIKNLPLVLAILVGDAYCYDGWGCGGDVDLAVNRALSEAFQSQVTMISGSREDLAVEHSISGKLFNKIEQPEKRTLRVSNYKKQVTNKRFSNLKQEYLYLLNWLKQLGVPGIYISNLTRHGIDIPVVRVVVPQLALPERSER